MEAIVWQGVHKRFGRHQALQEVSLTVNSGEWVALLGPNGSGKTTLLRLAAGIARPGRGQVRVLGANVAQRSALRAVRSKVGYMPQQPDFPPQLTVAEILEFFRRLKRVGVDQVSNVGKTLELTGFLHKRSGALSGGMRQRVALAIALLGNPEVLLLDEPTAGLDPWSADNLRSLLRQAAGEGCAVVMATHQTEDMVGLAQRAVLLVGGQVVEDGAVKHVHTEFVASRKRGVVEVAYGI